MRLCKNLGYWSVSNDAWEHGILESGFTIANIGGSEDNAVANSGGAGESAVEKAYS